MLDICLRTSAEVRRAGRGPTGAKLALKPLLVWDICIRLQVASKCRDLTLFELALDSKLRGCDLVALRVSDLVSASGVKSRVVILQRKTGRAVQSRPLQVRRSPLHSPVRSAGRPLGYARGLGSSRLWHSRLAQDQGLAAVQEDGQPARLSALAGANQTRDHREILGSRGG